MNNLIHDLAFLFAGWLLGIITILTERYIQSRHEYKSLFGRCYRIIEEINSNLAASVPWDEWGLICNSSELFVNGDTEEVKIIPAPPRLPDDFSEVINRLFEYEATHPNSNFGKKFIKVREKVMMLNRLFPDIKTLSKAQIEAKYPEDATNMYWDEWEELRNKLKYITVELDLRRRSYITRSFSRVSRKIRSIWMKISSKPA